MATSSRVFVLAAFLLAGAAPPPAKLGQARLPAASRLGRGRACPRCQLQGANLAGMDFTNANLAGADLSGADLSGARLDGAVLIGAKLAGAKLDGASLGATPRGPADLTGADLTSATFLRTRLNGAILQHATLTCADFSGVDTTRARFGPTLRFDARRCAPKFEGAKLGCEFAGELKRLGASGVTLPSCPPAAQDVSVTCGGNPPLQGLSTTVFVSATGQDSGTCGASVATACATIQTGIQQCGTQSGCGVLVMYGSYSPGSTIALANGVSVYGGCLPGSSTNPYQSLINAPAGGAPAVSASGITQATTFQGFTLLGTQAGSGGQVSTAMLVSNSSALTLALDQLVAGQGGAGNGGGNGGAGANGSNATDTNGAGNSSCSNASGGNGGPGMSVTIQLQGVKTATCTPACSANNCSGYSGSPGNSGTSAGGGYVGLQECYACPFSKGGFTGTGGTGTGGSGGVCGSAGPASGDLSGSFSGGQWMASTGGGGSGGGAGGGGGGGGGGGYCGYVTCFYKKDQYTGTTGGGGGSGGCGGGPGGGGQQGGASFGLVAISSTVGNGGNLSIISGAGGEGGTGGNGASGGSGGSGFTPSGADVCDGDGGNGGVGGSGGPGGSGGGGAGGNGGPAIGIALVSGSSTGSGPSITFYQGASGSPGEPGQGGTPASGACTGPNGNAGNSGTVADTASF